MPEPWHSGAMHDADEHPASAPVIDCAAYAGGRRVADVTVDHLQDALARPDQFLWLGLYEPDPSLLRRVQAQLGLHDLAIEDAVNAHQRPKLEIYDQSVFVVLRTAQRNPAGRIEFGETHLFIGANYVVTIRHGSLRSHLPVRHRCETTPHLLSKGPGYVLYAVMDFVVDQFLPIVQQIEEEVQNIEEEVLGGGAGDGDATARIYHLKRDLVSLRRAVSPLVDVCNRLMRFDLPHVPEDTKVYFRDVYDHVVRVSETIDAQRELLSTALEAHLSVLSVAQNEQMRRITAWAAMIAVPTMIAGVYGMNFRNMPELQWSYGYHASLAVMVLACLGLYRGFRRSGWL